MGAFPGPRSPVLRRRHGRAVGLHETELKKPDDYAVQETTNYIALVRKRFPGPAHRRHRGLSVYLAGRIISAGSTLLQKRLAKMKVRGLDFYRLDVDWVHFIHGHGSWAEV